MNNFNNLYKTLMEKNLGTLEVDIKKATLELQKKLAAAGFKTQPNKNGAARAAIGGLDKLQTALADRYDKNLIRSSDVAKTSRSSYQTYAIDHDDNPETEPLYVVDTYSDKPVGSAATKIKESLVCIYLYLLSKPGYVLEDYYIEDLNVIFDAEAEKTLFLQSPLEDIVADVQSMLDTQRKVAQDCFNNAKQIYEKFTTSLTEYTMHRGSDAFDFIKSFGYEKYKEAGGLGKADKWNPADIMLIRKGIDVESKLKKAAADKKRQPIVSINNYIHPMNGEVIGISLKQSENARHGSYTFQDFMNMFDDSSNIFNLSLKEVKGLKIKTTAELMRFIQNKIGDIAKFKSDPSFLVSDMNPEQLFMLILISNLVLNPNFSKNFDMAIRTAMSATSISAAYYKSIGSQPIHLEEPSWIASIDLVNVYASLDGNKSVYLYYDVTDVDGDIHSGYRVDIRNTNPVPGKPSYNNYQMSIERKQ